MTLLRPFLPFTSTRAPAAQSPEEPGVRPSYEVRETPEAYAVVVRLPGVARETLEVTADSAEVRVTGRPAWTRPGTWTAVHRETADVPFVLTLAHESAVDVDRIHAELKDGVLQLTLPKAEALRPRKVEVR